MRLLCILFVVAVLIGCRSQSDGAPSAASRPLHVSIAASATKLSPGDPVTLTVTAENHGDSTVTFGSGSSSCQLSSYVLVDAVEAAIVDERPCTMDLVPQSVAANGSTSESWSWSGDALVNGERRTLAPGVYEVRGAAGHTRSEAIEIEVVP